MENVRRVGMENVRKVGMENVRRVGMENASNHFSKSLKIKVLEKPSRIPYKGFSGVDAGGYIGLFVSCWKTVTYESGMKYERQTSGILNVRKVGMENVRKQHRSSTGVAARHRIDSASPE